MRFGKIFAKYLWRIIRQESMPVWLTLVLIIVGAILTNYYVPKLNQDFEKEKIRSAYILNNLNDLNKETTNILNNIRKLNNNLENKKEKKKIILIIEEQITKLQWRVGEYDIIFGTKDINDQIKSYQIDLSRLTETIRSKKGINPKLVLCRTRNFVMSSHRILRKIARKVELNIEAIPVYKIPENAQCNAS